MTTRYAVVLALACAASAQTPAFEVASVKIAEPITPAMVQAGRAQIGVTIDALNVRISKFSMFELMTLAFQVKGHQISGPTWMVTERYDVQAKLPEGGKRGQVPAMLQTLLAERFGLRYHKENREISIYALVVTKSGPHMKAAVEEPEGSPVPASGGQLRGGIAVGAGGTMTSTGPGGNMQVTPGPGGNLHLESKKMTMAGLVSFISRYFEQPLMDMTDLKGAYELECDVSGEEIRNAARAAGLTVAPRAADAPSDPSGVSLRSSLEKLGLKLEGRKTSVEVIVVDKLEKAPTEN
jgi:uncharacterized protein (TIGR03435 family)